MDKDTLFCRTTDGQHSLPHAASLLGWQLILYHKVKRQAEVLFTATSSLTNEEGLIHAGMLSAMIEECMGPAVFAMLASDQAARCTGLDIQLRVPVTPGRFVGVGTQYMSRGHRRYARGKLWDEQGTLVVEGTAIYEVIQQPLREGAN